MLYPIHLYPINSAATSNPQEDAAATQSTNREEKCRESQQYEKLFLSAPD